MATADVVTLKADELLQHLRSNKPLKPADGLVIEGDIHLESINYSHKLVLKNCLFMGHVNFADADFAKTVNLSGCTFEQNLSLAGARFGGGFGLGGVTIQSSDQHPGKVCFGLLDVHGNLDMEGIQSDVELDFNNARIVGKIKAGSLPDRPMICKGGLCFEGANLFAQVDLHAAEIQGNLDFTEAIIAGSLNCNGIQVHKDAHGHGGNVLLRACKISGEANLAGATLEGSLDLQSGEIRCGLFCSMMGTQPTTIAGEAHLPASRIAVIVDFRGARLGGLNMLVATVEGYLHCGGALINGDLGLQNAHIKGNFIASGLRVTGHARLDPVAVGGNIEFQDTQVGGEATWHGSFVEGDLYIHGSRIAGDLVLGNVHFKGDILGPSTPARRLQIGGKLWMGGARVEGEVAFPGLRVAKDFDLRNAEIREGLLCHAVESVEGPLPAEIGGDLNLQDATIAGGLKLQEARIGGRAQMSGVTVSGALHGEHLDCAGDLDVEGATVSGGVHLEHARFGRQALFGSSRFRGDVNLMHARIERQLDLQDSVIDGDLNCQLLDILPDMPEPGCGHALLMGLRVLGEVDFTGARLVGSLNLERAVIDSDLDLSLRHQPITHIGGTLVLESCRVRHADFDARLGDSLEDAPLRQALLPPLIKLDCFEFQELTLPDDDYRGFLERSDPFKKSVYGEVERWLHNRGDDSVARRVFHAMRGRQRQEMTRRLRWYQPSFFGRWLQRGLHRLWDLSGALGTQFMFFAYFTVAFALTLWIFLDPASVVLRDHPPAGASLAKGESPSAEEWNWLKSVAMTVQVLVPLVPIRPAEEWEASHNCIPLGDTENCWITYRHYVELVGLVSSLMIAFLGMGITNIVARRRAARLGAT